MTPTKRSEVVEVASSEEVNPTPSYIIADFLSHWMSQVEAEAGAERLLVRLRRAGVLNG